MNRKIQEKTRQLENEEVRIKKELTRESGKLKSKAARVGKVALISGVVSLVLYGIYKAFFQSERSENQLVQTNVQQRKSGLFSSMTDRLMNLAVSLIGKFIDAQLKGLWKKDETDE